MTLFQTPQLQDCVLFQRTPTWKNDVAPYHQTVHKRSFSTEGEMTTVSVPSMGDSISEGTVVEWIKGVGDAVHTDEVVVVVETDKISIDVNAPYHGIITKHLADIDATVQVGAPLYEIQHTSAPAVVPTIPSPSSSPSLSPSLSPIPSPSPSPSPSPIPSPIPSPSPSPSPRQTTRVPVTKIRQRTIARMKATRDTAAVLTTFQECDVGEYLKWRHELGDLFQKTHGSELSLLSVFIKASVDAIRKVPAINGSIDDTTQEFIYHDYIDMNITLPTNNNNRSSSSSSSSLVTPVLRNVEKHSSSLADVEHHIQRLEAKVQQNALALEDLTSGTFTIANDSVYGALLGTNALTSPQVATLGLFGVSSRATTASGGNSRIRARPMMNLALTYDHRLIDGREAVTFLKTVADTVADPRRLVLGL